MIPSAAARSTAMPARTWSNRNATATVAINTFLLGTGSRADSFPSESNSLICTVVASEFREQTVRAGFVEPGDQMPVLIKDAPRLKASGAMQRLEDPCENAFSPGCLTASCGRMSGGCQRRIG
jgi:hypothetical protein